MTTYNVTEKDLEKVKYETLFTDIKAAMVVHLNEYVQYARYSTAYNLCGDSECSEVKDFYQLSARTYYQTAKATMSCVKFLAPAILWSTDKTIYGLCVEFLECLQKDIDIIFEEATSSFAATNSFYDKAVEFVDCFCSGRMFELFFKGQYCDREV